MSNACNTLNKITEHLELNTLLCNSFNINSRFHILSFPLVGDPGLPELQILTTTQIVKQELIVTCQGNVGRTSGKRLYHLQLQAKKHVSNIYT